MSVRLMVFAVVSCGLLSASAANAEAPSAATLRTVLGNFITRPDGPVIAVVACGKDRICGRMVGLGKLPATDAQNPDATQKSRALCGLEVLTASRVEDSIVERQIWQGRLYHAEKGTPYYVTMQPVDKGNLHVRGNTHVMGMTRSFQFMQTWQRTTAPYVACTAPSS